MEIGKLRLSIASMKQKIREEESSLRHAWSLPMSEVIALKESAERRVKSLQKSISQQEDRIRQLEREG